MFFTFAAMVPLCAAGLFKPARQLSPERQIDHALARLTFGARPGDADRVRAIGLDRWIDLQLHPERIPENPLLTQRLRPLASLNMTAAEALVQYPPKRQAGKAGLESDEAPTSSVRLETLLNGEQIQTLKTGSLHQREQVLRAIPAGRQRDFVAALRPEQRNALIALAPAELRHDLLLSMNPTRVVAEDLEEGKLLRAVYSSRQLEELLVDFWFNHFNIFLDKGADRYLLPTYEREVIRPRVLGKFHDLLLATAESPAMLFYLDNWQSVGPSSSAAAGKRGLRRGLNENYARELMELHTLGVDGGYTQRDVTEVARCFTGWTIAGPRRGGGFEFNDKMHDQGQKIVLGHVIPAGGGMNDGLEVLNILAHQPATARHISLQLATRFVSDNPSPALVARMAKTFEKKDGDLREVLRTMLRSPEFWSEAAHRAKLKTPFESVVSALRASNADVGSTVALGNELRKMGEPLYRKLEPTGYSNLNSEWVSSAGLLARMNFGLALAQNKLPGVHIPETQYGNARDNQLRLQLGGPDFQKK